MSGARVKDDTRRQTIPIIYVRGTHYEVGFNVGRTFASLIKQVVATSTALNESYIPIYKTPEGLKVYNDTLAVVKKSFPQYVQELHGTADGAQVEFHKLFLFHCDEILPNVVKRKNSGEEPTGCSTVYFYGADEQIFGHSEDASCENLNTFYIVSAHIIADQPEGKYGVKEEKFTSLCYAGHLPGYTMGYNHHGMIFTINTLVARELNGNNTPRHFITRALLAAQNYDQAIDVLKDSGVGAADGCSINLTFVSSSEDRKFYQIELGPAVAPEKESRLDIHTVGAGEYSIHCNHYLRLKVPEFTEPCIDPYLMATKVRMKTLTKFTGPTSLVDVKNMLGDQSEEHWIFRDRSGPGVKTICVGIFDLIKRTWSLYKDNPKTNDPMVVLPLDLKS